MGLPALAVCAALLPTIQAGRLSTEAVALLERAASPALGGVAAPWPGAGFLSSATSALVAYAYASRSCGRATREFEASLRYQRADGLVPAYAAPDAAAFAAAGSGLPPLAFWNATGALEGPAAPLAALPLHAVAALQIYRGCGDRELASAWAARMAPKLYAWHRFLRSGRDAGGGAVWLAHPLEAEAPWRPGDAPDVDDGRKWSRCLAKRPPAPCGGYAVVDARFNAVLARSDVALGALVDALERRAVLTRGAAPPLARDDAAAVAAWRSAAAAGAPLRTLATPRGALVSRDASGRAVPGGGVADLGAVFAPGFADARAARDAAVAALVSAAASPSFACGAAPIVDAGCDVSGGGAATWPRGARARPRDNVFVERGLRGAGAASVADWLRNATAALVLTAGGAGPGVTFYDAYDGAGAGAGRRDAVATAAAALVLEARDLGGDDVDDAPVSRGVVTLVVALAMAVAFGVAFACLGLNIAMIRALKSEPRRQRRPPAGPRQRSPTKRSPAKTAQVV